MLILQVRLGLADFNEETSKSLVYKVKRVVRPAKAYPSGGYGVCRQSRSSQKIGRVSFSSPLPCVDPIPLSYSCGHTIVALVPTHPIFIAGLQLLRALSHYISVATQTPTNS